MRLRRAGGGDRQVAWLWFAAAAGTLVLRPLWPVLATLAAPDCLFRAWTGIPCPTCGATRAVLALLDGRWSAALAFNPLAAVSAGAFVLVGVAAPLWIARGGPVLAFDGRLPRGWIAAGLVALAANWVWLLTGGRV